MGEQTITCFWIQIGSIPSVLALMLSVGCNSGSDSQARPDTKLTMPAKKGVAIHYSVPNWPELIIKLEPHWHYHWGANESAFQPEGVDFVPMIWGRINNNSHSFENLSSLIRSGQYSYLLGFNEPDNPKQSNMSVDQAVILWRQLEQFNTPLVSPAATAYNNRWMREFMEVAATSNLHVDYLALHWYSNPNPQNFLKTIDDAYKLYGLPIWVTEFAVADWEMPNGINRWTEDDVISFMKTVLPELDKRSYVHRYSWFSGNKPELASSALYTETQALTRLGEVYRNHTPNQNVRPSPIQPNFVNQSGNLLNNGNFELGNDNSWTFSDAKIVTLNQVQIEEGYLAAELRSRNGQIQQQLITSKSPTTESKNTAKERYTLTFRAKSAEEVTLSYTLNEESYTHFLSPSDQWTEHQHSFEIEQTNNTSTLIFQNLGTSTLIIDAISLKEAEN